MERILLATTALSKEEAGGYGVSRSALSKVTLQQGEVGAILSELLDIESKVGPERYFSNHPLRTTVCAWGELNSFLVEEPVTAQCIALESDSRGREIFFSIRSQHTRE